MEKRAKRPRSLRVAQPSSEDVPCTTIHHMPAEILYYILSFLDFPASALLVCRSWTPVAKSLLYQHVVVPSWDAISARSLAETYAKYSHLVNSARSFTVHVWSPNDRRHKEWSHYFSRIKNNPSDFLGPSRVGTNMWKAFCKENLLAVPPLDDIPLDKWHVFIQQENVTRILQRSFIKSPEGIWVGKLTLQHLTSSFYTTLLAFPRLKHLSVRIDTSITLPGMSSTFNLPNTFADDTVRTLVQKYSDLKSIELRIPEVFPPVVYFHSPLSTFAYEHYMYQSGHLILPHTCHLFDQIDWLRLSFNSTAALQLPAKTYGLRGLSFSSGCTTTISPLLDLLSTIPGLETVRIPSNLLQRLYDHNLQRAKKLVLPKVSQLWIIEPGSGVGVNGMAIKSMTPNVRKVIVDVSPLSLTTTEPTARNFIVTAVNVWRLETPHLKHLVLNVVWHDRTLIGIGEFLSMATANELNGAGLQTVVTDRMREASLKLLRHIISTTFSKNNNGNGSKSEEVGVCQDERPLEIDNTKVEQEVHKDIENQRKRLAKRGKSKNKDNDKHKKKALPSGEDTDEIDGPSNTKQLDLVVNYYEHKSMPISSDGVPRVSWSWIV